MEKISPPPSLQLAGDIAGNWRKWKQRFQLYLQAIGKEDSSSKMKNAILLTVAGNDTIELYNTFTFNAQQQEEDQTTPKYDQLIKKMDDYCEPKKNETYERYIFRLRVQIENEPIDQFITDVKVKAKSCNYGAERWYCT